MPEPKRQRVRRTLGAQSPGPPPQLNVGADVLADLAGKVGELTAEVRGVKSEVREVKADVKEVKNQVGHLEETVQQQAITNETAHGEMKSEMRALGVAVAGLEADKRTPPPGGASAGRSGTGLLDGMGKVIDVWNKWSPTVRVLVSLVTGGTVLTGIWKVIDSLAAVASAKGAP